jgi:hypothetical protein
MAAGELAQSEAGHQVPAEPGASSDAGHDAPAKTETDSHGPETNAHGADARVAEGGHGSRPVKAEDLPVGSVVTPSGRVSAATEFRMDEPAVSPFSAVQLTRLDEALTLVSRHTRLRFSIYLGDLGDDSHAGALRLHDQLGAAGADSVLVAVDPQRHNVDIVTGTQARVRLADRACKLAVMSMVASFKEGDLLGGLLSGLRMLSDQAGQPHH